MYSNNNYTVNILQESDKNVYLHKLRKHVNDFINE